MSTICIPNVETPLLHWFLKKEETLRWKNCETRGFETNGWRHDDHVHFRQNPGKFSQTPMREMFLRECVFLNTFEWKPKEWTQNPKINDLDGTGCRCSSSRSPAEVCCGRGSSEWRIIWQRVRVAVNLLRIAEAGGYCPAAWWRTSVMDTHDIPSCDWRPSVHMRKLQLLRGHGSSAAFQQEVPPPPPPPPPFVLMKPPGGSGKALEPNAVHPFPNRLLLLFGPSELWTEPCSALSCTLTRRRGNCKQGRGQGPGYDFNRCHGNAGRGQSGLSVDLIHRQRGSRHHRGESSIFGSPCLGWPQTQGMDPRI